MELTRPHQLTRIVDGALGITDTDDVVIEEPLEIRIRGSRIAVVMRTPGHDDDLVRGFLLTERIVANANDILRIEACATRADDAVRSVDEDNVIEATLRHDVDLDLEKLRRNLYASSSCGICGKAAIENVMETAPPIVDDGRRLSVRTMLKLPAALRRAQPAFTKSGGLHAAGLHVSDDDVVVVREDVGRHNAVDKVIGYASQNIALNPLALVVSGRVSFEIVQKAAAARIPILVAVSAASSLAVELAHALGITVVGFTRGENANIYSHPHRIVDDSTSAMVDSKARV